MLFKKMFRDIGQNLSQFLAIFLMIFLGVFVYVGIGSEIEGMNKNSEEFYKETNMPDLWVSGTFTNDDLSDIVNTQSMSKKLTISGNIDNKDETDLEINFINSDKVSSLYVTSGDEFDYNSDKIWFDSELAKHLDYKVGDEVTINFNGMPITKEIAGLVMNPEHVYAVKDASQVFPSHDDYGFVYLSSKYYPLGENNIIYNYILIDTDNPKSVKNDIENSNANVISVTDRDANTSYAMFRTEIDSHKTYAGIFPVIFLFIAVLSVITTMNRIVKNQRSEIGILKALGFKKSKIIWHYTLYGFIVCLLAVIAGHILGPLLLGNYILALESTYFSLPVLTAEVNYYYFIISAFIIFIISLATYFSCFKELEGVAAETLRPKAPKKLKHTWIEKQKIWHHLKFKTQWNLRDVFRSKARSLMAIIGVAGSTMLVVCAFGMLNTLDNFISWQYDDIYHFKNQLTLETPGVLPDDLDSYGTTESLGIEIKDEGPESLVIDDSGKFITYTNYNKEKMDLPDDGVMITEKLADKYNLEIGDDLTFKIYGTDTWHTLEVTAINRAPSAQNVTMSRENYESLGYTYVPAIVYTDENVNSDYGVVYDEDTLRENSSTMLNTMSSVIVIMIVAALLLGAVVIYNLGILSYTEKIRELATLKVLGFNSKMVGKVLKQQNIWLTIIGIIIGLPLGFKLVDIIFSTVMGYSFDIMPVVNISSYVIAFVCIFIMALIVSAILNRKVKKLDMVTSLKAAE